MAILRKIKESLKRIVAKAKPSARKEAASLRGKAIPRTAEGKAPIGTQEMMVGQAKFSHPEPERRAATVAQDLPWGYGQDKAVLQVRDPWWLHSYWEITGSTIEIGRASCRERV